MGPLQSITVGKIIARVSKVEKLRNLVTRRPHDIKCEQRGPTWITLVLNV
jgi:hypothetical protein